MKNNRNHTEETLTDKPSTAFETGTHDFAERKTVVYPFGKYQITVELTSTDQFVGIVEVKLNKDFRSYSQKIASTDVHDVEEYYKDE